MNLRDLADTSLFYIIYIPFAAAVGLYVISGGAVGAEAMVKFAFISWWVPLTAVPVAFVLVVLALGRVELEEWL